jgi:hypothetical protein
VLDEFAAMLEEENNELYNGWGAIISFTLFGLALRRKSLISIIIIIIIGIVSPLLYDLGRHAFLYTNISSQLQQPVAAAALAPLIGTCSSQTTELNIMLMLLFSLDAFHILYFLGLSFANRSIALNLISSSGSKLPTRET